VFSQNQTAPPMTNYEQRTGDIETYGLPYAVSCCIMTSRMRYGHGTARNSIVEPWLHKRRLIKPSVITTKVTNDFQIDTLISKQWRTSSSGKKEEEFKVQGGSNMTGTDLYVNKTHCAAAVRPWECEATTSTLPPARVRICSVLSGSC